MSNFFKRVFSGKQSSASPSSKKEDPKEQSQPYNSQFSVPQSPRNSVQYADVELSTDPSLDALRQLYSEYSSKFLSQSKLTEEAEQYMENIMKEFYSYFSQLVESPRFFRMVGNRSYSSYIGQPSDIIMHISISLLDAVDVNYSVRVDLKEITVRSKQSANESQNIPTVMLKEDQEDREKFVRKAIAAMQCISIIPLWPHNCFILSSRLGQNFVHVIFGLGMSMVTEIEKLIQDIEKGSYESLEIIQEKLKCRLKLLLLAVHFIENSCEGNRTVTDELLPRHPWTMNQLNAMEVTMFSVENMEINNFDTQTIAQDDPFGNFCATKSDWFNSVLHYGGRQILFALSERLQNIQMSLQLIYHQMLSNEDSNVDERNSSGNVLKLLESTWEAVLVIECELQTTMSSVISDDKYVLRYFETFKGSEILHSWLNKCLPAPFLGNNNTKKEFYKKLVLRRSLTCLQSFKNLQIQTTPQTPVKGLNSNTLGKFLAWCRFHFDPVDSTSLSSIVSMFQSHSIECSSILGFEKPKYPNDFWPWSDGDDMAETTAKDKFDFRLCKFEASSALWHKNYGSMSYWKPVFEFLKELIRTESNKKTTSEELKSEHFKAGLTTILTSIYKSSIVELLGSHSSQMIRTDRDELPCFQMHMMDFIEHCMRTMPALTKAVISECNATSTILSSSFLFNVDLTECSNSFEVSVNSDITVNRMNIAYSNPSCMQSALICARLEVNDRIFCFLYDFWKSVITSNNSELMNNEDIFTVLIALNNQRKSIGECLVVQVVRLVSSIMELIASSGFRDLMISSALIASIDSCQRLLGRMGIQKMEPSSFVTCADFNDMDKKRLFLWPARSSLLSLLHQVVNESSNTWIQIFLDDNVVDSDLLPTGLGRVPSMDMIATMETNNDDSWTNTQSTPASDFLTENATQKRQSSRGRRTLKGLQRVKYVAFMLLEPRIRPVAMEFLMAIAKHSLDAMVLGISRGNSSSISSALALVDPQKFKQLILEVIIHLLDIIGFARKYPNFCDGNNLAILILRALTWLFRCDNPGRQKLQDIANEGSFVSHLLFSLTQFSRSNEYRYSQIVNEEEVNLQKITVLRQGLAFLTTCMFDHASNKNEFGAIVSFGQSKSDSNIQSSPIERKSKYLSYENIKTTILMLEPTLSIETIIVLFEMILEVPHFIDKPAVNDERIHQEGLFCNYSLDRPKIKNLSALALLFGLLTSCESKIQAFILKTLKNLIFGRASLANLSACSRSHPRLLDMSLDLFPNIPDDIQELNVTLLELLGRYGVSVSQLKHLFRILQSKGENRPDYTWRVLKSLHGMFSDYDGPRHTFVFEGVNSGLQLPPIYKWPTKKGMSFCVWLSIEAHEVAINKRMSALRNRELQKQLEYRPYVLSLRNNAGFGCELFLQSTSTVGEFKIVLRWYNGANEVSVLSPDLGGMVVQEGKWHFLAFSVAPSTSFYAKDEAIIMLDDQIYRNKIFVSKLPENVMVPMIGDLSPQFCDQTCTTALRGQLGATYFFGDVLTEGQLRGIKELGPAYFYSFEPFSADSQDVVSKKMMSTISISSILDGSLSSQLVLAYNPTVWKGEFFLDNTPVKNEIRWRVSTTANTPNTSNTSQTGSSTSNLIPEEFLDQSVQIYDVNTGAIKMHARRLRGTEKSSKQDVRMALDSLGGLKTLLPLFIQFDQPRISHVYATDTYTIDSSMDVHLCPNVLELFVILFNDDENQSILRKIGGISLITYFLERVSPQHFTQETFKHIITLYEVCSRNVSNQDIFLDKILCNPRVWMYTSPTIQCLVQNWLIEFASLNSKRARETIGIRRIIEILYWYFDYEGPYVPSVDFENHKVRQEYTPFLSYVESEGILDSKSHGYPYLTKSQWIHPITGDLCGEVPIGDHLVEIRNNYMRIVGIISQGAILPEDIETIASYVIMTKSVKSKLEGLELLHSILAKSLENQKIGQFLLGLACTSSLQAMLPLCSHHDVNVRLSTFFIVAKVFQSACKHRTMPELSPESQYAKQFSKYLSALSRKLSMSSISSTNSGNSNSNINSSINSNNSAKIEDTSSKYLSSLDSLNMQGSQLTALLSLIQGYLFENISTYQSDVRECLIGLFLSAMQLMACGIAVDELYNECKQLFGYDSESGVIIVNNEDIKSLKFFNRTFDNVFGSNNVSDLPIKVVTAVDAIINTLRSEFVSLNMKHATLITILQMLTRSENCDRLVRSPGFHNKLLEFHDFELNYLETLKSTQSSQTSTINTSEAIVQVINSICHKLLSSAMLFGKPTDVKVLFFDEDGFQDKSLIDIMKEMTRSDRILGTSMLRDSLLYYQYKSGHNSKHYVSTCFRDLRHALNSINESNNNKQGLKQVTGGNIIKTYAEKLYHANICSIAHFAIELSERTLNNGSESTNIVNSFAKELFECLYPILQSTPEWMLEERLFIVQVNNSRVNSENDKSTSTTIHFGKKRFGMLNRKPPLSHLSGGYCWSLMYLFMVCLERLVMENSDEQVIVECIDRIMQLWKSCNEKDAEFIEFLTFTISFKMYNLFSKRSASDALIERNVIPSLILMMKSQSDAFFAFFAGLSWHLSNGVEVQSLQELAAHQSCIESVNLYNNSNHANNIDLSITCETNGTLDDCYRILLNKLSLPRGDNVEIDSAMLSTAITLVLNEFNAWKSATIAMRQSELGLSKTLELSLDSFVAKLSEEKELVKEANFANVSAFDRIVNNQLHFMKETLKNYEMSVTRNELKWNGIWQELANERGPWGIVGTGEQEIFWTLDIAENNRFLRTRLKRNEYGNRHTIATQRAQGKSRERSNSLSDASNLTSEAVQGMWKDLVKYKKKSSLEAAMIPMPSEQLDESYRDEEDDTTIIEEPNSGLVEDVSANLFSNECEVITVSSNTIGSRTLGTLEVTKTKISFSRKNENETYNFVNKSGNNEFMWACRAFPTSVWQMNDLVGIARKRYLQREIGVEFFFSNRKTVFFNFFDLKIVKKLIKLIFLKIKPPNLFPTVSVSYQEECLFRYLLPGSVRNMTQAWVHREISNFDYLMFLNALAGRTFNDLSQYPVFPWVIADYTSKKIDLRDPKVYRDFQWPMGAQQEHQRRLMQEKFDNLMMLDECPPYHNGSHYSTSGFVLWYLIRMEPFTSLHVWLQDGKFDKPDRLFFSIEAAYRGCTSNIMDVKELIPEFFCNPDFLENINSIDLGTMQNGKKIGSVILPPWSRNAHDFVRINREALESDYVSRNIHHWIDLIFGYKQRPPHLGGDQAAVNACNVFSHWSYVNAVDLEELRVNDPDLFQTALRQIDCFGQTPKQLFFKPHPERLTFDKADIIWPIASIVEGVNTIPKGGTVPEKPQKILCFEEFKLSQYPIIFIYEMRSAERLVTVDSSRLLGTHVFKVQSPDVVPPYSFKLDPIIAKISSQSEGKLSNFLKGYSMNAGIRDRRVGVPFASQGLVYEGVTLTERYNPLIIGKIENKLSLIEEEAERIRKRDRLKERERERERERENLASSMNLLSVAENQQGLSPSLVGDDKSSEPSGINLNDQSIDMSLSTPSKIRSTESSSTSSSPRPMTRTLSTLSSTSSKVRSGRNRSNINTKKQRVDDHLSSHLFGILPEHHLLFSCGHWDNSFKVTQVERGTVLQSVLHHRDVVTCIAVASDFHHHWLITGARDCTVVVWEVIPDRESMPITAPPLHILCGHDSVINCIAVNPELDIVVSGSDDGTLIMHTLREGIYLRSLYFGIHVSMSTKSSGSSSSGSSNNVSLSTTNANPSDSSKQSRLPPSSAQTSNTAAVNNRVLRRVHMVCISRENFIVAYSLDGNVICTYSVNGRLLRMIDVGERLHCMCLSEDGKVLITGGERCLVVLRWVATLFLADNGARKDLEAVIDGYIEKLTDKSSEPDSNCRFTSPIRSLYLTNQERHLIVGLESGEIRILAQDSEYLRRRLHKKLMEIGILPQSDSNLGK